MHYLTSNFNNLNTNHLWNNLQYKYQLKIDPAYNNFYFAINNRTISKRYEYFHLLIYCESSNYQDLKKRLTNLIKLTINKNLKKTFHIYLINEISGNLNKNTENFKFFNKLYNNLNLIKKENLYIHTLENLNQNFFNLRNEIFIKFPFDINIIKIISKKIEKIIKMSISRPYKLIILDCDNTLWGGVLDENKIQGIRYSGDGVGQIYEMFQQELKRYKNQGFLLSISSKNNEKIVWSAMKERSMNLNKTDVSELLTDEEFEKIGEEYKTNEIENMYDDSFDPRD